MTRAREYCRNLIEAACLLALIVVPLFFNMFSSRVFDPDKSLLMRSIGVAIVVIALVTLVWKLFEEPTATFPVVAWLKKAISAPLAVPIALFCGITALSTSMAISPRTAFWGSFLRMQGAFTTFSMIVLFLGLIYAVRDAGRLERVVKVIVLTSVPVAVYGIAQ